MPASPAQSRRLAAAFNTRRGYSVDVDYRTEMAFRIERTGKLSRQDRQAIEFMEGTRKRPSHVPLGPIFDGRD